MKFGERLKAARTRAKLTQQQLADKVGGIISQAGISHLERKGAAGSEFTSQFAIALGVSPEWLATGTGEMAPYACVNEERASYSASEDNKRRIINELISGLTESQKDDLIRELEEKKQRNDALIEELLARRKA